MATAETTDALPGETPNLLHRMQSLEVLFVELNEKVSQLTSLPRDRKSNWISRMWGCMSDFPGYEEVVRLGREARQAD